MGRASVSRIVWSIPLVLVKRFVRSFVSRVWVEAFREIERERDREKEIEGETVPVERERDERYL